MAAADETGDGAAFDHRHGADRGVAGIREPAVSLHHEQRPGVARGLQLRLQLFDVALRFRAGVSVDHGRRGAFVFARQRRDVGGRADETIRCDPSYEVAQRRFMRGIPERPQQANRDRADPFIGEQFADRGLRGGFIERFDHRALVIDAFTDPHDIGDIDERRRAVRGDRMLHLVFGQAGPAAVGAAGDAQRILEARGRQQRRCRAAVCQQDIVDDGRAVDEQPRVGEQLLERQAHRGGRRAHGIEHPVRELRRGRQHFADFDVAVIGCDHRVGAGTPHIRRDDVTHWAVAG